MSETTCLLVMISPSAEMIKPDPIFCSIFLALLGTLLNGSNGLNGSISKRLPVEVVFVIPTVTTEGSDSSTTFVITDECHDGRNHHRSCDSKTCIADPLSKHPTNRNNKNGKKKNQYPCFTFVGSDLGVHSDVGKVAE